MPNYPLTLGKNELEALSHQPTENNLEKFFLKRTANWPSARVDHGLITVGICDGLGQVLSREQARDLLVPAVKILLRQQDANGVEQALDMLSNLMQRTQYKDIDFQLITLFDPIEEKIANTHSRSGVWEYIQSKLPYELSRSTHKRIQRLVELYEINYPSVPCDENVLYLSEEAKLWDGYVAEVEEIHALISALFRFSKETEEFDIKTIYAEGTIEKLSVRQITFLLADILRNEKTNQGLFAQMIMLGIIDRVIKRLKMLLLA